MSPHRYSHWFPSGRPSQGSSLSILTEPHDERATLHSITSSASAITVGGTVSPSLVAVLRLMANSNLVGACTGSSAGFAPFKMRSTYEAERRKMSDVSGPYDIRPPSLMTCR